MQWIWRAMGMGHYESKHSNSHFKYEDKLYNFVNYIS